MTIQDAIDSVTARVTPLLPKLDLPTPVAVVEKAFDYTELFVATARGAAVEAARAISPATKPVAVEKPAVKKPAVKKATAA